MQPFRAIKRGGDTLTTTSPPQSSFSSTSEHSTLSQPRKPPPKTTATRIPSGTRQNGNAGAARYPTAKLKCAYLRWIKARRSRVHHGACSGDTATKKRRSDLIGHDDSDDEDNSRDTTPQAKTVDPSALSNPDRQRQERRFDITTPPQSAGDHPLAVMAPPYVLTPQLLEIARAECKISQTPVSTLSTTLVTGLRKQVAAWQAKDKGKNRVQVEARAGSTARRDTRSDKSKKPWKYTARLGESKQKKILEADAIPGNNPDNLRHRYQPERNETAVFAYNGFSNQKEGRQSCLSPHYVDCQEVHRWLGSPGADDIFKAACIIGLKRRLEWEADPRPPTPQEYLKKYPVELFKEKFKHQGAPTLEQLDLGGRWRPVDKQNCLNRNEVFAYLMWYLPYATERFGQLSVDEQRLQYEQLPARHPQREFPPYEDLQLESKLPEAKWKHENDEAKMCESFNRVASIDAPITNVWIPKWMSEQPKAVALQPTVRPKFSVTDPRTTIVQYSGIKEYGPQPSKWNVKREDLGTFTEDFGEWEIAKIPDADLPPALDLRDDNWAARWRDRMRVHLKLRNREAMLRGMSIVDANDPNAEPMRIYDRFKGAVTDWPAAQAFVGVHGRTTVLKIQVMFPKEGDVHGFENDYETTAVLNTSAANVVEAHEDGHVGLTGDTDDEVPTTVPQPADQEDIAWREKWKAAFEQLRTDADKILNNNACNVRRHQEPNDLTLWSGDKDEDVQINREMLCKYYGVEKFEDIQKLGSVEAFQAAEAIVTGWSKEFTQGVDMVKRPQLTDDVSQPALNALLKEYKDKIPQKNAARELGAKIAAPAVDCNEDINPIHAIKKKLQAEARTTAGGTGRQSGCWLEDAIKILQAEVKEPHIHGPNIKTYELHVFNEDVRPTAHFLPHQLTGAL
ncbi:hypothetical protein TI39_contig4182g00004 [Zymoseptoria brevis]|uniref:Uncharacterized protein n=1 Tax=Zymoseptoria brevis TaxID=1047168 RepID=A0A0F4GB13_9PEZI|nr:hypothetical protein TI39_contig4182g00004 [Zymoseptoria brevis]